MPSVVPVLVVGGWILTLLLVPILVIGRLLVAILIIDHDCDRINLSAKVLH